MSEETLDNNTASNRSLHAYRHQQAGVLMASGSESIGSGVAPNSANDGARLTSTALPRHLSSDNYCHTQPHPTQITTTIMPPQCEGYDPVQPALPSPAPPSESIGELSYTSTKKTTSSPSSKSRRLPLVPRTVVDSSSEDENDEDRGSPGAVLAVSPTALRLLLHEETPSPPSPPSPTEASSDKERRSARARKASTPSPPPSTPPSTPSRESSERQSPRRESQGRRRANSAASSSSSPSSAASPSSRKKSPGSPTSPSSRRPRSGSTSKYDAYATLLQENEARVAEAKSKAAAEELKVKQQQCPECGSDRTELDRQRALEGGLVAVAVDVAVGVAVAVDDGSQRPGSTAGPSSAVLECFSMECAQARLRPSARWLRINGADAQEGSGANGEYANVQYADMQDADLAETVAVRSGRCAWQRRDAEGVNFTLLFVNAPLCGPSRSAHDSSWEIWRHKDGVGTMMYCCAPLEREEKVPPREGWLYAVEGGGSSSLEMFAAAPDLRVTAPTAL